jgi:predicted phosphodiesterase
LNSLVFTDPHIEENSLIELKSIFVEIISYKDKAQHLIMLGDFYEKKTGINRAELVFGTYWAKKFKESFARVTFLRGNHGQTKEGNLIDYLTELGIEVVDDYVDNNIFFGHFLLHESLFNFGESKIGIKDLEKYKYSFLGHQHSKQTMTDKIFHIGSCRFVDFQEVKDDHKQIVLLDNNNNATFVPLKSPTPMLEVNSLSQLENVSENTKVRLSISSFEQFKQEINEISKWKDKFREFKLKLNFEKQIIKIEKGEQQPKQSLNEFINNYLEKIEDNDVKNLLNEVIKEEKIQ